MSLVKFIPFALPDISQEEIKEVTAALQSGWITSGPKTRQFEDDFASFMRKDASDPVQAIAVNSATAGLHLALEAIGLKENDEVIVPIHTFTATAEVVRYFNAKPVFADVRPNDLNISPDEIKRKITSKTKAVIPMHFAGQSCAMAEIISLCCKRKIKIIEDAAHALPTKYHGNLIGQLDTDATVFSFYATKTMTTGEGGMIITRNPKMADRMRIMRLHGINRDVFQRDGEKNKRNWYYEVVAPGYKYNLSDILSAVGIIQLRKVNAMWQRRKEIAEMYSEAFQSLPFELPKKNEMLNAPSWYLYVIRLHLDKLKFGRDIFIQKLFEKGIGTSVHFIPLHLHPYWQRTYKLRKSEFPIADSSFQRSVSLPIYSKMTDKDILRVKQAVKKVIEKES
jgi:dTDP-4-amino-4,6-dideoxygalactose transaminase